MEYVIETSAQARRAYQWLLDSKVLNHKRDLSKKEMAVKKAVREYNNRPVTSRYIWFDDDGSYIKLIELPEDIGTYEEAEKYFQDNLYIPYYPKPWDCTGQFFTSWHDIYKRNGRYIIYHQVNRDV